MPTYEYECEGCKHRFEEFQSIKDKPLTKCPKCKKSKLKRLFGTGAGLLFKGDGFYITDYRSESYQSAAKADKEASSKASESNESKEAGTEGGSKKSSGKRPKSTG